MLPYDIVEHRLSQLILDRVLRGVLDQGNLIIFENETQDVNHRFKYEIGDF